MFNTNNVVENEADDKSLFFTSAKRLKRRNQSPPLENRGAAVPPPATFEYFGPSASKQQKPYTPPVNLEASISAGLKFLRQQVDKGNKNKWSASNDYDNNS